MVLLLLCNTVWEQVAWCPLTGVLMDICREGNSQMNETEALPISEAGHGA